MSLTDQQQIRLHLKCAWKHLEAAFVALWRAVKP